LCPLVNLKDTRKQMWQADFSNHNCLYVLRKIQLSVKQKVFLTYVFFKNKGNENKTSKQKTKKTQINESYPGKKSKIRMTVT
jgi:hypothetical protein